MELIIKEAEKKNKITNTYEINIIFMVGDADGSNEHVIRFDEKLLNDSEFKNELELFLKSVSDCIKQDSRGRGGLDSTKELIHEYKNIKNWIRYCTSALEDLEDDDYEDFEEDQGIKKEDLEYKESETYRNMFMYYVPCTEDWYNSYRKLIIQYYDSNGDIFPVEIKF